MPDNQLTRVGYLCTSFPTSTCLKTAKKSNYLFTLRCSNIGSIFILIAWVLFPNVLWAEVNVETSKDQIITQQIDSLLNECRRVSQKPDSLMELGAFLVDFGKEKSSDRAYVEGYFAQGLANYYMGHFELAIAFYDSAISIQSLDEDKYQKSITRVVLNRGITFDNLGKYQEAKQDYRKLMALAKTYKNANTLALAYNQIGITEKSLNEMEKAIDHFELALNIWDSIGVDRRLHGVYTNLGSSYKILNDIEGAMKYDRIALAVALRNNMVFEANASYSNISVDFRGMGLYDSALYYLSKTLPYYQQNNMAKHEIKMYQNIAHNLMFMQQYDSAKSIFHNVLVGFDSLGYKLGSVEANRLMGETNLVSRDYDSAIIYFGRALELSKQYSIKAKFVNIYEGIAKSYEAKSDFQTANKFLRYKEQIKDSTYSIKNLKTLNEILTRYEVASKDEKITLLNEKKSFYQSLMWPFVLGVGLLGVIAVFLYKRLYSTRKDIQIKDGELDELRKELNRMHERRGDILEDEPTFFHLRSKAVIPVNDLMYIQSDTHYLEFYLKDKPKPEIDRSTFREVESVLPHGQFVRVHRSYLVNIHFIKIINSTKLMLENGTWISISRTYKATLKEVIKSGYSSVSPSTV